GVRAAHPEVHLPPVEDRLHLPVRRGADRIPVDVRPLLHNSWPSVFTEYGAAREWEGLHKRPVDVVITHGLAAFARGGVLRQAEQRVSRRVEWRGRSV